jgi:hypothetical protein
MPGWPGHFRELAVQEQTGARCRCAGYASSSEASRRMPGCIGSGNRRVAGVAARCLAVERRITALWRDVVTALGAAVTAEHTTAPVPLPGQPEMRKQSDRQAEVASLRAIAPWMRT